MDADAEVQAQAEAKLVQDAVKLPLEEQVADKSWKIRKQGYELLQAAVSSDTSLSHNQSLQLAAKGLLDSNLAAQESACDFALELLHACSPSELQGFAANLAGSSVSGPLSSSKKPAAAKGRELLMRLTEHGFNAEVLTACSKGYSHKIPRVGLAAAEATLAVRSPPLERKPALLPVLAPHPAWQRALHPPGSRYHSPRLSHVLLHADPTELRAVRFWRAAQHDPATAAQALRRKGRQGAQRCQGCRHRAGSVARHGPCTRHSAAQDARKPASGARGALGEAPTG